MNDIQIEVPPWDGNSDYNQHIVINNRNCWIRSNGLGHLCGYAEISDEELYHAPRYRDGNYTSSYSDFDVHGGITWEGSSIKGITTQEYSTLVGFDTAHSGDAPHPMSKDSHRIFNDSRDTYKDEKYIINELVSLTEQIDKIHKSQLCKRPGE